MTISYTRAAKIDIPEELSDKFKEYFNCVGIKELEKILRQNISAYKQASKKGYRSLAIDIEGSLYDYLSEQNLSDEKIDLIIAERSPSHTYIREFHNGRNICINYMNTLAFFFNVSFMVNNFAFCA